jgi:hypothetical protein
MTTTENVQDYSPEVLEGGNMSLACAISIINAVKHLCYFLQIAIRSYQLAGIEIFCT